MSVKPKDKILTFEQARELKWFCNNVTGLRQEYYNLMDKVNSFNQRMLNLEKTAEMILKYCKENDIKMVGEE